MSEAPEEPEVVDGELVDARRMPVRVAASRSLLPAAPVVAQVAAVAATGFVAGAATLAVARRARGKTRRPATRRPAGKSGPAVVASRSFLIDVHLLGADRE